MRKKTPLAGNYVVDDLELLTARPRPSVSC
jgi:hypothetical protein